MRKYDWSRERVEAAICKSNCWFDCLEHLGVPKVGYNYRTLKGKVKEYGLDVSHFDYHYAKTHNGKHVIRRNVNRSDDEIFSYASRIKVDNLKREYIKRFMGGVAACEMCGIVNWNGKPLTFQLHHVNGDHKDHVRSNLQLLCPNCHSQTDNYSNKTRKDG